jgi:glycine/D-amino acid oxidase-like deaminating enzyme
VMGFSVDGLPFVGKVPGRSGQVLAAGFTGHGFGMAWNCTRLLGDEMLQGRLSKDLVHMRPSTARIAGSSNEKS